MKEDTTEAQLLSIEDLAAKLCSQPWELRAMKVQNNWASGLRMSESDFKSAQTRLWTARLG